uniref:Uncharacterized protein n=1 Tax=Malurus cyaneus samueli TaxID=2593467 RepID=A0A8C5UAZ0_9PASS
IVRFLLEHGVDVKSKDECGKTALILAVEMENPELVTALLEKDEIDIDDADEDGNTALMVAVERSDCNIAKTSKNICRTLKAARITKLF